MRQIAPCDLLWFAAHDLRLAMRRVRAFFGAASPTKVISFWRWRSVFHLLAWGGASAVEFFSGFGGALSASRDSHAVHPAVDRLAGADQFDARALHARRPRHHPPASPMSLRPVFARAPAPSPSNPSLGRHLHPPVANMMALVADWRWLAIHPTLIACGFFGAGVGLFLMMAPVPHLRPAPHAHGRERICDDHRRGLRHRPAGLQHRADGLPRASRRRHREFASGRPARHPEPIWIARGRRRRARAHRLGAGLGAVFAVATFDARRNIRTRRGRRHRRQP